MRIIVTRRLPDPIEQELSRRYEVKLNPDDRQFTATELSEVLRDCEIVLCTLTDPLARSVFEAASPIRTRLLANFGVGFNHIDLDAARVAGIAVTNTPGVLTDDTADHTILLMLATARRAFEGERELRDGQWTGWRPTHLLGTRVSGKTLGIIGFGRIGQAVATRAHHGLGMTVRYFTRRGPDPAAEARTGATAAGSLDELLRTSDVVSLHCPATPETFHLIDADRLRLMQRHAFLINTSRGDIVDENALVHALEQGTIAGAGLDVYEREPAVHPGLLARTNTVLLPHLGSATLESRVAMGRRVLANIAAFIDGQPLPDRIA
jgi:lactate dehydrogenase-like 2-hydroxyacid dehydrogenase